MDPKNPTPTPAEEADQIGGDVNPYPVGEFKHAREDAEKKAEQPQNPLDESPLEEDEEQ